MSDRFEEAVRDAAQQLGEHRGPPDYQTAYRRGTTRLRRKRAAMGAVCALALFGGLATGGQFDRFRSTTIETDEVAIPADAIPATPVPQPTDADAEQSSDGAFLDQRDDQAPAADEELSVDEELSADQELSADEQATADAAGDSGPSDGRGSRSDDSPSATQAVPFAATATPTPSSDTSETSTEASPAPSVAPVPSPTPRATVAPTPTPSTVPPTPTATPSPTALVKSDSSFTTGGSPAATATATVAPTPSPIPTPTPSATAVVARPTATATAVPTATATAAATAFPTASATVGVAQRPSSGAPPTGAVDPGIYDPTDEQQAAAPPTPNRPNPAEVPQVLEESRFDRLVICDVTGDSVPDGECRLLAEFRCTSATRVTSDYRLIDADRDGEIDTCLPVTRLTCDTDYDGVGDTPCTYEPYP